MKKFILALTASLSLWSVPAWAQIDQIDATIERLGANGGTSADTIDSSTATLLLLFVASDIGDTLVAGDITDSEANTWVLAGSQYNFNFGRIYLFYVANPTGDAAHSVTVTCTLCYAGISFTSWTGTAASLPFDQTNGNSTNADTVLSTGSVTPTTSNQLVITAINPDIGGTMSVDSPFSILHQDTGQSFVAYGLAVAYTVQGSATAENPQWTRNTSSGMAAGVWTFKDDSVVASVPKGTLLGVGP